MATVWITPRMAEVIEYVKANPQCTKRQVAASLGSSLSSASGTVDRAIANGLIASTRVGSQYRLTWPGPHSPGVPPYPRCGHRCHWAPLGTEVGGAWYHDSVSDLFSCTGEVTP